MALNYVKTCGKLTAAALSCALTISSFPTFALAEQTALVVSDAQSAFDSAKGALAAAQTADDKAAAELTAAEADADSKKQEMDAADAALHASFEALNTDLANQLSAAEQESIDIENRLTYLNAEIYNNQLQLNEISSNPLGYTLEQAGAEYAQMIAEMNADESLKTDPVFQNRLIQIQGIVNDLTRKSNIEQRLMDLRIQLIDAQMAQEQVLDKLTDLSRGSLNFDELLETGIAVSEPRPSNRVPRSLDLNATLVSYLRSALIEDYNAKRSSYIEAKEAYEQALIRLTEAKRKKETTASELATAKEQFDSAKERLEREKKTLSTSDAANAGAKQASAKLNATPSSAKAKALPQTSDATQAAPLTLAALGITALAASSRRRRPQA